MLLTHPITQIRTKYLQFKKRPTEKISLELEFSENKRFLKIKSQETYEISNPIFNSLGSLVSNPPYEVFVRKDRYICLIEIPDLCLENTS